MTHSEYLIICTGIVLFVGMLGLYRTIDRLREVTVCNSKLLIKLSDGIGEMIEDMELQRKAGLEIVGAIRTLSKAVAKQEDKFILKNEPSRKLSPCSR